jgi:hypothetical protein
MKTSSAQFLCVLSLSIGAAALLTSCSPGTTSSSPSMIQPVSRAAQLSSLRTLTSLAVVPMQAVRPDGRKSWMSPDVKRTSPLAFVSDDAYDVVDVFSLPDLTLKGTITGLSEPQGMCSGSSGNVWIADTGTEEMFEYSGAGQQIATIVDGYGYPVSCAVDLNTGDLAVTNLFDFNGAGGVYVYPCPTTSCTPKELTIPNQYYYYFDGYDPNGDLFVSGKSASGTGELGEVPAGSSSGFLITISSKSPSLPGWVQWDKAKSYLALGTTCGTAEAACVDWVKISGSKGKVIGETTLLTPQGGHVCDLTQGAIDPVRGKYLVAGDYQFCGSGSSGLNRWRYPAGGKPTNFATGLDEPIGTAISVK